MKAISSAYPNRNNSYFTKESMEKAIPTFFNKPILGSFSVGDDDFRGHEGELEWDEELQQYYFDYTDPDSETPLGLIRAEDKVELVQEADGLYWIKFTCALWVKYSYKLIKRLLKSYNGKKKISVEVEVNDYYVDENGIEVITDFTFDGVTILSDNLETGIAGAELTILDKIENFVFKKKEQCLVYAYSSLENSKNKKELEKGISKDPVVNEGEEEITMKDKENQDNQKGGKFSMLTYEAKRNLIESWLNTNYVDDEDYVYIWVADMDDISVYFSFKGEYFKASYSIDGDQVYVDFDNREKVIRSWEVFTEEPKTEDMEKTTCEDGKECKMVSEDIADECGIRMSEEGGCEEKEMAKEDGCECKTMADDEGCECKGTECKDTMKKEEHSDSEGCTFEELSASYLTMNKEFNELKAQYSELQEKYEKLVEEKEETYSKQLLEFGYNLVNEETEISEEKKTFIKDQITEKNNANRFENEDAVKKFTVSLLAMAVYENRKMNKEGKENHCDSELSLNFNNSVNNSHKKTSYEEMNESADRLRRI